MGKVIKSHYSTQAQPHSSFGQHQIYKVLIMSKKFSKLMQKVLCTLEDNRVILL